MTRVNSAASAVMFVFALSVALEQYADGVPRPRYEAAASIVRAAAYPPCWCSADGWRTGWPARITADGMATCYTADAWQAQAR